MNYTIESSTFKVLLLPEAHSRAELFRRHQSNPQKAKQVYLNTLAVYAVKSYLQHLKFETDWSASDSWNPVMQTLMDVADLEVKARGFLECRPVLSDSPLCYVPPEVWSERIGYVVVQLNESLSEATLLGFVEKVTKKELSLSQLRSLEDLPRYLNQIEPAVNLSQWFKNVFETGWQTLEALLGTNSPELAFRYHLRKKSVQRAKLIELERQGESVAMIVALTPKSEPEMVIVVEVQPQKGQTYLPLNMALMVLDEEGETVMEAQTRDQNKNIQLQFNGEPGDRFSIKVILGDVSVKEDFVI